MTILLIALGAAVGAPARYLTDRAIQSRHATVFPWGTFTVNVFGSFIFGVLAASTHRLDSALAAGLGTGFCGALTTYSTFSYETCASWRDEPASMRRRTSSPASPQASAPRRSVWPSEPPWCDRAMQQVLPDSVVAVLLADLPDGRRLPTDQPAARRSCRRRTTSTERQPREILSAGSTVRPCAAP